MSKFCPLANQIIKCTDDCNKCMEEEARKIERSKPVYPCDTEPFICPFNAETSEGCRYYCGLGVDEDEPEDYDMDEDEFVQIKMSL